MLTATYPSLRLRRLRRTKQMRALVRETRVTVDNLIHPIFIKAGNNIKQPISSMPGHAQLSLDYLAEEIAECQALGINNLLLFGIPEKKDAIGSDSLKDDGIVQQGIRLIKSLAPDILIIADLCFCEYADHGHCGVIDHDHQTVDNDATLPLLVKQAVSLAKAGADIIAPSGMMDGMVQAIRVGLDKAGFSQIPILSYAVKYASSFYGPFREAAEGAPQFGDRRDYQMDPANSSEALREATLDIQEGADMLMVKPAQNYLDIIFRVKQAYPEIPMCAYQVSGEFAMIKAAAKNGWINEEAVMLESLLSIKRAGADFIITYFAKQFASL